MTEAVPLTRLLAVLRHTATALDAQQQHWALVGGLAVSVRCEPRFTRDVDLVVDVPDDSTAERLISNLLAGGFTLHLSLEHHALKRLAAVRLIPPGESEDGIVVDLLFASSGIEAEICRDAGRLELPGGVSVPVAQAGHLIAMKLLAVAPDRPQDAVDLQALRAQLTPHDRERARAAVQQIEQMGANRSKRLVEAFDLWLGSEGA